MTVITGHNFIVAKVIFLHLSVILFMGGSASVHGGIPPAKETPLPCQGNPPPPANDTPLLPRRHLPAKETPCQGYPSPTRPTAKGEIEGDQIQAHTQGGNQRGSDPGPHPRAKLRGIRSRPTPKGEIEGGQIQAPLRSRLRHTVNERPVRILLECILV